MNAHPEHLHQELERVRRGAYAAWQASQPSTSDLEVQSLAALARFLQTAPPLQVVPAFADRLEHRLLAYHAARQRHRPTRRWWGGILPRPLGAHPTLTTVLSLCLFIIFLGTGILVAAAQVTNPDNPLYALKHWEQQVQVSLSGSPAAQAELDLQTAREWLNRLPGLAAAAHAGAYRQTLADFEQQFGIAEEAVHALPAGPDHARLAGELVTLQADARRTLRSLLLQLTVPEQQATTDELGLLGETVPHLTRVEVTIPAPSHGQVSISISGDDLQAGAALLVDGQLVPANGTLQQGRYLFLVDWQGEYHPHSIGILNPDGTVAQTTAIIIHTASGGNGNGNGGGNGSGRPTPTPRPGATPTPTRPDASPTPHLSPSFAPLHKMRMIAIALRAMGRSGDRCPDLEPVAIAQTGRRSPS